MSGYPVSADLYERERQLRRDAEARAERLTEALNAIPTRVEVDVNGEYMTTRARTASEFKADVLAALAGAAVVGEGAKE